MIDPLNDRVLVRRVEPETKMKGGLYIPETAQEKPLEAIVISVGPGRANDAGVDVPLHVKAKDRVLVGKYAGTEIRIDDTDHVILREDEIIGIVRNEKK